MKISSSLRTLLPLIPATALILRLAGYGRSWLPSPATLGLLVALAHLAPPAYRAMRAGGRTFFRRHAFTVVLATLVALAVVVRLPGLGADLGHTPLDIDENRLAGSVKHFFDTGTIEHRTVEHYPGAVFWVFSAAAFLRYVHGLTNGIELPPDQIPVGSYVLAARVANVFMAAVIVWLSGLIGRRLSGPAAGLLAAAVVAFVPLSVETTTVVRNDPGMLLAVVGAVYVALVLRETGTRSSALAAGFIAGLATAIKYSSMFAIVPVAIAAVSRGTSRDRLQRLALAGSAFAIAIAVSNHFIWWDFTNFLRQLTAQVALTAAGHWATQENPAAFYVEILNRFGPGVALVLLAAAFAVYALCTRDIDRWIFVSFPLLYLWFMTQRPAQFPRWVFPLVPFVAIAGAAMLAAIVRLIASASTSIARPRARVLARAAAGLIAAAALAQPAWGGLVAVSRRLTSPTHAAAEQWLETHAAPGSVVASDVYFLDFSRSKLKVRRLDFETMMPAGAIDQLAGADWLVVPEPYFGNPMLRRLGFVQRFHADQGFGGRQGYDYEVYAVPKIPQTHGALDQ
jgi:4-amino-4-deoxy-L-arabinose transferase-like glycosyltransferase